jgi:thiol-disulfide isomerase/thioredoxin
MNKKIKSKIGVLLLLVLYCSCSKTEDNVPLTQPTAEITVDKLVRKASLINQDIPFRIINELENDVTNIATFYVNGQPIESSVFTSPAEGEFEVYGVYTEDGVEITTNTESFSVIIPKRKIVVEDYTGTWCGFCPRVAGAITDLHEETEDISVVAIHETANSFPDPMHFEQVQILKDAFGVQGFPSARINRSTDWAAPHIASEVTSLAGLETNLAIALNSELTDGQLLVQVNVVYEEGSSQGDKLVVYLVENGILYDQINYYNEDSSSPFFNLGDPIPDFEHNEVLRVSLSSILGDPIPNTAPLSEYITSFTLDLPSEYIVDNLEIIAMIVDADNVAKNSQHAVINEDKAYE